ncbi:MAG: hypothetical protein ACLFTV_16685, partial [Desulfococcaceae bacterium]
RITPSGGVRGVALMLHPPPLCGKLKILPEKPFRPRPGAERFAVGKPDRLSPLPQGTNWKPAEKSIWKPLGTKWFAFKPGGAVVRRANSYRFRDVLGRFCRAGGERYEMTINIKLRSAKKTAFNVRI